MYKYNNSSKKQNDSDDEYINIGIIEQKKQKQKKKMTNELITIDVVLEELYSSIKKYEDSVKIMWDNDIQPFTMSECCFTLNHFDNRDYHKFLTFMKTQKCYKIMMMSEQNLQARRMVLTDELNKLFIV